MGMASSVSSRQRARCTARCTLPRVAMLTDLKQGWIMLGRGGRYFVMARNLRCSTAVDLSGRTVPRRLYHCGCRRGTTFVITLHFEHNVHHIPRKVSQSADSPSLSNPTISMTTRQSYHILYYMPLLYQVSVIRTRTAKWCRNVLCSNSSNPCYRTRTYRRIV